MTKTDNIPLKVDVLIVGGGIAGCSLAIALDEVGFAVAIVDRVDPSMQTGNTFDGRASAIAGASQKMLGKIGFWPLLKQQFAPILDIRVSDGESRLFLHYDHEEINEGPLGFMVENRHLRQAAFSRLKNTANVTYIAPVIVNSIIRTSSSVEAILSDGRKILAEIIVGADGRRSQVRESANINVTKWPYQQTGIVLTVDHEFPHYNVANEHFLPAGPFAILPLPDRGLGQNRSSIVWTEKDTSAQRILNLPDAGFATEFSHRFGNFLGQTTFVGPRWSYPLCLHYVTTSIAERLVLIGDAAHGMHPIAGQGLNMGLRDVAALAEILTNARRLGLDIGSKRVLDDYQKWRRFDNSLMLAMTDALNRLFSNTNPPIKLARDIGLAMVNKSGPLKLFFMKHAMGAVGNRPRLLKGERL
jgi:2-octaprenyl-6-methoxyphenol hydroxylase